MVNINKLLDLRTIANPEFKSDGRSEYILGVDVARSEDTSNNQSSTAVLKIRRGSNENILSIDLVNIINISNALSFTAQAIEIKKIQKRYRAKAVCLDTNGLGVGLCDELMKDAYDANTGECLGCWATINTDKIPEVENAEKMIYDLKPQSANSEVIVTFMEMVESGKLHLLEKKAHLSYDVSDKNDYVENALPFVNTDLLIEEIANLQLKHLTNGKISIDKVIKKINKDRFSALAYGLWYIKKFESSAKQESTTDAMKYLFIN